MEENQPTVERAATENSAAPKSAASADIATLVAEHHAAIYRYAYRLAGTECDAEDLTQQTFLAAQLKLDQLRDPEHGRGWLYAILRNSYLKMRRKRSPVAAACLELDIDAIPDEAPEASAVDPERLQTAINELPDEFKVVLLLFYFEGCSYREIAEKLSLPAGTVMSRLSRAKGHLRSRLFDGELHAAPAQGELQAASRHGAAPLGAALPHALGESSRALRARG